MTGDLIGVNFGKYLKSAFLYHWNLLAFLGGMGFAVLTGHPDVFGPLVLAGEVAYLGLLGTHPRFQKYIDSLRGPGGAPAGNGRRRDTMPSGSCDALPDKLVQRFESPAIALPGAPADRHWSSRSPQPFGSSPPLEDLQLAGLDRLLWIYLRLLFTQTCSTASSSRRTRARSATRSRRLEQRIRRTTEGADAPQKQKLRKSPGGQPGDLPGAAGEFPEGPRQQRAGPGRDRASREQDPLAQRAGHQPPGARLHLGPGRPGGLGSMVQTERTMNELQFATGLEVIDEQVPAILRRSQEERSRMRRGREDEIRFL